MSARAPSVHRHLPVLLREVVRSLNIVADGLYVDATYGRGGHSQAILKRLNEHGRLIAMDRDPQAVAHAKDTLGADPRCRVLQGELKNIGTTIGSLQLDRKADGVLADLGVSSPQLDDPERGFSFNADGPLDMRMDPTSNLTAADWLNQVEERELTRTLQRYGEERYAARIARAVVSQRVEFPITSTKQLSDLVVRSVPTREKKKHPATRTFQAIRMRINAELEQLAAFLPRAVDLLSVGGRLVVISFHSLEDRLVKRFFRDQTRDNRFPADLPVQSSQLEPLLRIVGKPCRASATEIEANPRARSATLRVAERTEFCHA